MQSKVAAVVSSQSLSTVTEALSVSYHALDRILTKSLLRRFLCPHSFCIATKQPKCHYRPRRPWHSQSSGFNAAAVQAPPPAPSGGRTFWYEDGETAPALTGGHGRRIPADSLLPLKRYLVDRCCVGATRLQACLSHGGSRQGCTGEMCTKPCSFRLRKSDPCPLTENAKLDRRFTKNIFRVDMHSCSSFI